MSIDGRRPSETGRRSLSPPRSASAKTYAQRALDVLSQQSRCAQSAVPPCSARWRGILFKEPFPRLVSVLAPLSQLAEDPFRDQVVGGTGAHQQFQRVRQGVGRVLDDVSNFDGLAKVHHYAQVLVRLHHMRPERREVDAVSGTGLNQIARGGPNDILLLLPHGACEGDHTVEQRHESLLGHLRR
eukprot:scaffold207_cov267-Pinguiococcus_pyrenoidosus.AAC.33